MNTEAKVNSDETRVEELEVDQERKREPEEDRLIDANLGDDQEERSPRDSSSFVSTAEIATHRIQNINGTWFTLPRQPAGVFAAISQEANEFIDVIVSIFDKDELAAIQVLEHGAEAFGAEGGIGEKLEEQAIGTVAKKTVPKIIELLAGKAPEFMAKVVAMILEPDPDKIRKGQDLTYDTQEIIWKFSPEQQIAAIGFYIDSLNLGALKKKVRSFRQA